MAIYEANELLNNFHDWNMILYV